MVIVQQSLSVPPSFCLFLSALTLLSDRRGPQMIPEYAKIHNPVCLDDIRDCLLNSGFPTLMDVLAAIKSIMDLARVLKVCSGELMAREATGLARKSPIFFGK